MKSTTAASTMLIIEMCTRQAKRNLCIKRIFKLKHRKLWLKPIKAEVPLA